MSSSNVEALCLSASRGDWPELLSDWQPLIPEGATPWILTRFGEVVFKHADGHIGFLQTSYFNYEVVAKDSREFETLTADLESQSAWFQAPLVARLESSGKRLSEDRCYSFITPLGLGGELKLENVMIITIREHFGMWGQVFQQIKDLPPGAEIVFKTR
jgi:hypothetical protein